MNTYFHSRGGLRSLNSDLATRPCKIAFLGNSVTAQKEGYAHLAADQLNTLFKPDHEFIYAGLGGIGSLASCFLMDDFVLRHNPDLCFVECTVADIGHATPNHYLEQAIKGIIHKLIASDTHICFLHLFNTHTSSERIVEVIEIYEEIIDHYDISSINIASKINSLINSNQLSSEDILYDGVHTTEQGAEIYSESICSAFTSILEDESLKSSTINRVKNAFDYSFTHTQIVLPESLINETSSNLKKSRFRGVIKYVQMDREYTLHTKMETGIIVGFLIIADESSGVLKITSEGTSVFVQTYDQWCHKERIQAVILDQPVQKSKKLSISLSALDQADRGANGTASNYKHQGSSFKLIGLMTAFESEPREERRLW